MLSRGMEWGGQEVALVVVGVLEKLAAMVPVATVVPLQWRQAVAGQGLLVEPCSIQVAEVVPAAAAHSVPLGPHWHGI